MHGFWQQLFAGKTVYRACTNLALANCPVSSGRILDIGGTRKILPSYRQYLRVGADSHIEVLNIDPASDPDHLADASQIPCDDNAFDTVWCINTIEHVMEPDRMLDEANRVLKAGGLFILNAPFIYRIHRDPEDYLRLSDAGLFRAAQNHGFKVIDTYPVAVGVLQASFSQLQMFLPRVFFIPCLSIVRFFDRIIMFFYPQLQRSWTLGFLVVCTK